MPRPKGFSPSPESRAKTSATLRARGIKPPFPKRTRPLPGTDDYRRFIKIERHLGAAAAHAELRRGA